MSRIALPILIVSLATLGGCSDPAPSFQGYVEGEYVYIASPVAGRLEKLHVQRGQTIVVGAPLFRLEADMETAALQQAEAQLKATEAQLADLSVGRRNPELDVTRAQLAQARAAEVQAAQQLARDEAQFQIGGIPRSQLEDSRANHDIKQARVRELEGQLQVSRLPARDDQIRAQDAQVAAARAAWSEAKWRLGQKDLTTQQAGLVADTLYREGEWVPAGSPVVRLLPPQNVKLRFFVPEKTVGGLAPGRNVTVQCDGCATEIAGVVSFVSNQPEYTPPVIYSNETRDKLVFMVEARPSAESASKLHPGQPAVVTLQ
jgi:HlyD family secretion protein